MERVSHRLTLVTHLKNTSTTMTPAKRKPSRKSGSTVAADPQDREVALPAEVDSPENENSETQVRSAGVDDADLQDRIRRRAYELYRARRDGEGCELDDWLAAEREMLPESAWTASPTRTAVDQLDHTGEENLAR